MPVVIELPPQKDQVAFNLKRWEELSHDPSLADLGKRIETDRYGHVIMSMYPGGWHGSLEARSRHPGDPNATLRGKKSTTGR